MNFSKAVRASLRWLKVGSIWFWIAPGLVEYGLWFILFWALFVWPRPEAEPSYRSGFALIAGTSVAAFVTGIRQRLHPLCGPLFGSVAVVSGVAAAAIAAEGLLVPAALLAQGSWARFLRDLLTVLVIGVGGLAFVFRALLRGQRERHCGVPRLIELLTAGHKNSRRKAIVMLGEIAIMDRGAAREDGAAWVRRMRRWIAGSDTPSAMDDAIPALQGALRDDDFFVRKQAAKVLTRMRVVLDGPGEGTSNCNST